jgi:hypothetical protein
MRSTSAHARVRIETRPLWRIRVAREWPRYLVSALAVAGLVASARFAIDPPRPVAGKVPARGPAPPDLAAEGFASLFARGYLTWNAAEPQAHERGLASFAGPGIDPGVGLQPPSSGEQRVQWTEVVQAREPGPGEHVYTVAAQTDDAGLEYLTVSVVRTAAGSLALGGYPAFVGAPATGPAQSKGGLREVSEPALATVVGRALRNYLSASSSELAADLTSNARVSLPAAALSLESVQRLDWAPSANAVLAVVQAEDARAARYTLAYELDVARVQGRWEVSAIQMDPDT